jgi:SAM-dependent methyltransferase
MLWRAYDEMGEAYADHGEVSVWNALYERPATIALLGDVAGRDVLDAGCGAGPLSAWLAENGANVVGIDGSSAMVALARERVRPPARFAVADLAAPLDFPDASFDLVVASLVLHYLEDWDGPLRELRRVLRPGGALVCSTHHLAMKEMPPPEDYFATELVHDRWEVGGQEHDVTFWRRPLSAMFDAFAAAGLTVERVVEPQPVDECRERFPEWWQRLSTEPWFLFFRLRRPADA